MTHIDYTIEVLILKRVMIDAPCLERWLEDMYLSIILLLEILDERIKHFDINAGTGGVGVGVGITDISAFEDKWEGILSKGVAHIDVMAVFAGGKWFLSLMECVDFV